MPVLLMETAKYAANAKTRAGFAIGGLMIDGGADRHLVSPRKQLIL